MMSLAVQIILFLGIFEAVTMVPQQRPVTRAGQPHVRRECGSYIAVSHLLSTSPGDRTPDNSSPLLENGGMASLHNSATDLGSSTHKCGAVLISDRYLLTAAHCVVGSERFISISLGREDLDKNPFPGPDTYQIQNVAVHPDYGTATHEYNDIAILKTERKVQYSNKIWPFCLPDSNLALNDFMPLLIAGWGHVNQSYSASILQTAYVRLVMNSRCDSLWREQAPDNYDVIRKVTYPQGLTKQVLCAGRQGVDACGGDSGGPLSYQNSNGLFTVIGLIGKRNSCPKFPVTPGFYTNVANYIDWIVATTGLPRLSASSNAQQPIPLLRPAANTSPGVPIVLFNGPHDVVSSVSSGANIGGSGSGGTVSTAHLSDIEFINGLSGTSSNGQVSSSASASGSDSINLNLSEIVDERNAARLPTDRIRQEPSRSTFSQALPQKQSDCQFPSGQLGFCRMITLCFPRQSAHSQLPAQVPQEIFVCGRINTNIGVIQNVCCPN